MLSSFYHDFCIRHKNSWKRKSSMKKAEKDNKMNTKKRISYFYPQLSTTQKSIEMNYELIVVIIRKTIFILVHDTYDVDDDEILSFFSMILLFTSWNIQGNISL